MLRDRIIMNVEITVLTPISLPPGILVRLLSLLSRLEVPNFVDCRAALRARGPPYYLPYAR
jgi:hypothetical protein